MSGEGVIRVCVGRGCACVSGEGVVRVCVWGEGVPVQTSTIGCTTQEGVPGMSSGSTTPTSLWLPGGPG